MVQISVVCIIMLNSKETQREECKVRPRVRVRLEDNLKYKIKNEL